MTTGSRHRCERHRWVEGAEFHWSEVWPLSAAKDMRALREGSMRLATIVFASLLAILLLGAVGSASPAQAGAPAAFDGGEMERPARSHAVR